MAWAAWGAAPGHLVTIKPELLFCTVCTVTCLLLLSTSLFIKIQFCTGHLVATSLCTAYRPCTVTSKPVQHDASYSVNVSLCNACLHSD